MSSSRMEHWSLFETLVHSKNDLRHDIQLFEQLFSDPDEPDILFTLEDFIDNWISNNPQSKDKLVFRIGSCLIKVLFHNGIELERKSEILKLMNILIKKLSRDSRVKWFEKQFQMFQSLAVLLMTIGDFEIQTKILEFLVRVSLNQDSFKRRLELFESNPTLSEAFYRLSNKEFENQSRTFLNRVNWEQKDEAKVKTLVCKTVQVGNRFLVKPKDDNYEKFWVDFNLGTKSILIFCQNDETEDEMWNAITIFENMVSQITIFPLEDGSQTIEIRLNCSSYKLFDSATSDDFEGKSVKITFDRDASATGTLSLVFPNSKIDVVEPVKHSDNNRKDKIQEVKTQISLKQIKNHKVEVPVRTKQNSYQPNLSHSKNEKTLKAENQANLQPSIGNQASGKHATNQPNLNHSKNDKKLEAENQTIWKRVTNQLNLSHAKNDKTLEAENQASWKQATNQLNVSQAKNKTQEAENQASWKQNTNQLKLSHAKNDKTLESENLTSRKQNSNQAKQTHPKIDKTQEVENPKDRKQDTNQLNLGQAKNMTQEDENQASWKQNTNQPKLSHAKIDKTQEVGNPKDLKQDTNQLNLSQAKNKNQEDENQASWKRNTNQPKLSHAKNDKTLEAENQASWKLTKNPVKLNHPMIDKTMEVENPKDGKQGRNQPTMTHGKNDKNLEVESQESLKQATNQPNLSHAKIDETMEIDNQASLKLTTNQANLSCAKNYRTMKVKNPINWKQATNQVTLTLAKNDKNPEVESQASWKLATNQPNLSLSKNDETPQEAENLQESMTDKTMDVENQEANWKEATFSSEDEVPLARKFSRNKVRKPSKPTKIRMDFKRKTKTIHSQNVPTTGLVKANLDPPKAILGEARKSDLIPKISETQKPPSNNSDSEFGDSFTSSDESDQDEKKVTFNVKPTLKDSDKRSGDKGEKHFNSGRDERKKASRKPKLMKPIIKYPGPKALAKTSTKPKTSEIRPKPSAALSVFDQLSDDSDDEEWKAWIQKRRNKKDDVLPNPIQSREAAKKIDVLPNPIQSREAAKKDDVLPQPNLSRKESKKIDVLPQPNQSREAAKKIDVLPQANQSWEAKKNVAEDGKSVDETPKTRKFRTPPLRPTVTETKRKRHATTGLTDPNSSLDTTLTKRIREDFKQVVDMEDEDDDEQNKTPEVLQGRPLLSGLQLDFGSFDDSSSEITTVTSNVQLESEVTCTGDTFKRSSVVLNKDNFYSSLKTSGMSSTPIENKEAQSEAARCQEYAKFLDSARSKFEAEMTRLQEDVSKVMIDYLNLHEKALLHHIAKLQESFHVHRSKMLSDIVRYQSQIRLRGNSRLAEIEKIAFETWISDGK